MVIRCNICDGLKHADRACHSCGAVTIFGITFNPQTWKEMARAKNAGPRADSPIRRTKLTEVSKQFRIQ